MDVHLQLLIQSRSKGWKTFLLDFSSAVEYVTGEPVDLKTSSQDHDAAIEEELETLRSKVDQLTDEVGISFLSPLPAINKHPI